MTQSDRYKYPLNQTFRVLIASIHVIVSLVTHTNTKIYLLFFYNFVIKHLSELLVLVA